MNYHSLLLVMLQNCKSWEDLKQALNHSFQAGKLFEIFCKYYFLTEPSVKDDYQNIWLFEELPQHIREKLNLGKIEHGVDLVLEDKKERLTALQCKFRSDENSSLSWTKDKIGNLFGYAVRAEYFAVFSNASQLDKVSKTRSQNFTFFNISHLLLISKNTFDDIRTLLSGISAPTSKKFEPLDHQEKAISATIDYFEIRDRGQLIMPCGAGKTLIALWIKEKLRAKNTLVLVPSLALLRQIKEEWAKQKHSYYDYVCVCSEKDIDKNEDLMVVHTYELGGRVSTNPKEIATFLKGHSEKVLFSTYQSLNAIRLAMVNLDFSFDLIICDEAHKTTGSSYSEFTLIHDNAKIPARKRLYMTATPRIISENIKTRLGEDIKYLCDMSNKSIYGDEIFRMSFKDAIDQNILVDYKIIGIGVTNQELQNHILQRSFVSNSETIEDVAHNYALNLVMDKYKAFHAITFHSRVSLAEAFSKRHKLFYPNVESTYVAGTQPTSIRSIKLNTFKGSPKAVISNARCLTEGIDVPTIDLIYFCDPRNSKIDIVQAAGRAIRKDHSRNKRLGLIVVPIMHFNRKTVEKSINKGVFKNLIKVVRSLSDQDERLQIEITNLAYKRGIKSRPNSLVTLPDKDSEEKITLLGFDAVLKKHLFDQIIKKTVITWDVVGDH